MPHAIQGSVHSVKRRTISVQIDHGSHGVEEHQLISEGFSGPRDGVGVERRGFARLAG